MFQVVTFNEPIFAWLAPFVFLIFLVLSWLIGRYQRRLLISFGKLETLRRFSRFSPRLRASIFLAFAVAFAFLAASEPKMNTSTMMTTRTLNGVIVLDVSRSMLAEDNPDGRSRSAVATEAALQLLNTYPDGYFGLVLFTDEAQAFCVTGDHEALRFLLQYQATPYKARGAGSNITVGLEAAAELVVDASTPVEIVIIISDGASGKEKDLAGAVRQLKQLGVKVVAGGVGGVLPARISVRGESGEFIGYHTRKGIFALTMRDESKLRFISEQTRGAYQLVKKGDDLIGVIRLHEWDSQQVMQEGEESLVRYPLLALLVTILVFLLDKRFTG